MIGAVLVVLVMLLVGPFLLFAGGAAWSALLGSSLVQALSAEAPQRD